MLGVRCLKKRQLQTSTEACVLWEPNRCGKSKQETILQRWTPELKLLRIDREFILSPVRWLTDSIINAAQKLLQDMCPWYGISCLWVNNDLGVMWYGNGCYRLHGQVVAYFQDIQIMVEMVAGM